MVLLNMGGPSNLFEVEVFLKNMFADEHILRIKNNFLRKLVGSFIVNKRLSRAQENYRAIGGKSPIVPITFSLSEKLNKRGNGVFYTYAMRYVPPYAKMVAQELQAKEIEEVILMSLYPQYSTTTTLSSLKDFEKSCEEIGYTPSIRSIERFYDDLLLLKCIQNEIKRKLDGRESKDYILILSAHGLPQSIIDEGDPYQRECEHHSSLLKEFLEREGMIFEDVVLAYQSRMGSMKWIEPSVEKVVKKMGRKKIILYPLAFSIDNSETIFELDIELRQTAQQYGIEEFLLCTCPNDGEDFVDLILKLTQGE